MVSCLERDISSAEDLAAVKIAIELCNSNGLKKEVLCAPGSEYHRNRSRNDSDHNIKVWKASVENKATTILENIDLPRVLRGKVTSLVILIGIRMLRWAKYHERILGLSCEYSIKFLNCSFFKQLGIIDNKKTAEELMKDNSLNTKQKYTLACLYCFADRIPDLFRQMTQAEKENFAQRFYYPEIVKFWSDYHMGELDKLRGGKTSDEYMLEKAIESGSKSAVEYCLEETSLRRKKNAVIDAALETTKKTQQVNFDWEIFTAYFFEGNPNDDFIDVLSLLLSKMSEDQKIEFLKKHIQHSQTYDFHPHSKVLENLLDWPYQNYFMKTAQLMWGFLPEWTYAFLLLKICNKMSPSESYLRNVEEKSYDYKKLLKDLWIQSPDHYKRYVFSDTDTSFWHDGNGILFEGVRLLIVKLFTLKNYPYEDREIFELILDSATEEEKESIISSEDGKAICIGLIEGERWEILDEFLSKCISSGKKAEEFKRRLSFTEAARIVCADFIKYKWEAAEFFIKWSSLSEEEIIRFKRELLCSEDGKYACSYLFLHKGGEIANMFCDWCFSSEEEIRKFKKELIFSVGVDGSADIIIDDKLEVVDKFIIWSHLSQEDIEEFKKNLQQEKGNYICEHLISGEKTWTVACTIRFQGGKWEQVEKFLTWCFSSEVEMKAFKKERILKISGTEIHYRLIKSNQWEEAERFFAWLELSPEEVKELKKETLFNHEGANRTLHILLLRRKDDENFSDFGSRQEAIELLLRWYLTDKDVVQEFSDHFKQRFDSREMKVQYMVVLKDFDSAIEQRLSDLDEEKMQGNLN